MKLFGRFKTKDDQATSTDKAGAKAVEKPKAEAEKKPVVQAEKNDGTKKHPTKTDQPAKPQARSVQSYQVLLRPLITEKATYLGALNKYVFAINPKMNKLEVKKAIRAIYKVDPVQINILNLSGKKIRAGRITGVTKSWKKAVVTLKPGDKIEVYEGV